MAWLLRKGEVLASAELADTSSARRRGLIGRDRVDGALVLRPCRQVHTIGMRFPIDVIWCDRDGNVLRVASIRPWRVSRFVWRARAVIEAPHGAAERWAIEIGDPLEVRADDCSGG
jgi:uncharacterized membrane protein (UPF0127 family)